MISRQLGPQSLRKPLVSQYTAMDCNVPILKKAHVQADLKFPNVHLNNSEKNWERVLWSSETKIKLFCIKLEEEKYSL